MADGSKIEWTDATWNIVTGCTLVSEGCRHCYAARLAATRLKHTPSRAGLARINAAGEAKFTGEVRFNKGWLDQPLRWRKPRRVFVCAHGDLFHEAVPDDWIDRVFAVMALAPQHTFQVLTKRPERMRDYLSARPAPQIWRAARALGLPDSAYEVIIHCSRATMLPLPNVWLGVSVEDQATADARIPPLLATPAAKRFISAEPLLGPVDLSAWLGDDGPLAPLCLDWVIAGGESGRHARPMHPDWPRALRDQCAAAGVPFFFKQWGEWFRFGEIDADGRENTVSKGKDPAMWHEWPDGEISVCLGKRAAGAALDGREHREFPA